MVMMLVKLNTAADEQSRLALEDGTAVYELSARYPTLRSFLEVYPDLQDGGAHRDLPVVARAPHLVIPMESDQFRTANSNCHICFCTAPLGTAF